MGVFSLRFPGIGIVIVGGGIEGGSDRGRGLFRGGGVEVAAMSLTDHRDSREGVAVGITGGMQRGREDGVGMGTIVILGVGKGGEEGAVVPEVPQEEDPDCHMGVETYRVRTLLIRGEVRAAVVAFAEVTKEAEVIRTHSRIEEIMEVDTNLMIPVGNRGSRNRPNYMWTNRFFVSFCGKRIKNKNWKKG